MRRTILASTAIAMAMLVTQANAGFLFFGGSKSSCCNSAPKCCAPKCSTQRRCRLTGMKLPKLELPKLRLPKLNLFGNKCCKPTPCCKPAPPTCSGGKAATKVEDVPPPPPYEDKAPAPPVEKKAAPAKKPAPAKKAAPAPAPEKKA
jgi:hypothetical protein